MDSTDDKERRKCLEQMISNMTDVKETIKQEINWIDVKAELWIIILRIETGQQLVTMEFSNKIRQLRNANAIIKSATNELDLMG